MLTRFVLFLLLTFNGAVALTQVDFRPGYVINNAGDTIYGDIDYLSESRIITLCRFKDNTGTITEYLPGQIDAFRFTGSRYFISRTVNGDPVFLEFLIKGKLNVYSLYAPLHYRYFVEKEGEPLSELPYREQVVMVDNREKLQKSTLHMGVLTYHMQDAPQLKSHISSITIPGHRNMIKIAENYHNAVCEEGEECVIYDRPFPPIKVTLELLGGMMSPWQNEQLGVTARFWLPYSSESFFVRLGYIHMGNALPVSLMEVGDSRTHRFIPFHVGYIMPQNYRVRPMASIGLASSDYSVGLTYHHNEQVGIGIQSYAQFYHRSIRWVPVEFKAISVLAGMYINLN